MSNESLPDGQRLVARQHSPLQRVLDVLVGLEDHEVPVGHPSTPVARMVPSVRHVTLLSSLQVSVTICNPGDDVGRTRIVAREAQHVFRIRQALQNER